MTGAITATADALDGIAAELETAARHARIAAGHFRAQEVPRGCAHTLAVEGHLVQVRGRLEEIAVRHADHAQA